MKTITGKALAWISEHAGIGPQDFVDPEEGLAGRLSYSHIDSDLSAYGYTRVGVASITLEVPDAETLVTNKIDALRAQATGIQAEAQLKVTKINEQINNLLAISYEPS